MESCKNFEELKDKWTHTTRVYKKNDKENVLVVGSVMNYKDEKDWGKLEDANLVFPEGKETSEKETKIFDKPSWGEFKISEDKKTVELLDTDKTVIYKYSNPRYAPSSYVKPENINDESKDIKSAEFSVGVDGELKIILPESPKETVKLYDDTSTSATNNGDSYLSSANVTTNYGSLDNFDIERRTTGLRVESIISFTLPAVSGTISAVKLYIYKINNAGHSTSDTTLTYNVYEVLRTDWVEAQVTYNIYKTSNNWTTAGCLGDGTDYSSTVIDADPVTNTYPEWHNWVLMGTGADNPLTLTWSDRVDLKIDISAQPASTNTGFRGASKEHATTNIRPYLEVTYTTSNISTINGLAKSSVSTFNGLAIASVKNINGLE